MTAHAAMLEALREARDWAALELATCRANYDPTPSEDEQRCLDENKRMLSVIRAAIRAGEEAPKEWRVQYTSIAGLDEWNAGIFSTREMADKVMATLGFVHEKHIESRIAAGEWEREKPKC